MTARATRAYLPLLGLAAFAAASAQAETHVYRTEARGGAMREVSANFWSALPQGNANTVDLDAAAPGHPFTGLGVSIPEASCWLLSRLPAEKRAEILRTVWTADGAGLSVARLQVGSSDYSMHAYTYDDVAGDTELKRFSIDPDRRYVLPVVKEIQKVNPDVTFFASPPSGRPDFKPSRGCGTTTSTGRTASRRRSRARASWRASARWRGIRTSASRSGSGPSTRSTRTSRWS